MTLLFNFSHNKQYGKIYLIKTFLEKQTNRRYSILKRHALKENDTYLNSWEALGIRGIGLLILAPWIDLD